jgi:hypothetical protein
MDNRNFLIWCILLFSFFSISAEAISGPSADTMTTAATRTFTFVNNCSYPVWLGFAGGSASSKLGGTTCKTNDDCHAGTSCIQTGDISQCFWNNPAPANGNFQVAAKGGTNTVTIPAYNNGIMWSGAVAGRTNCANGSCQTADCGNGTQGCKPSQGFNQPATQAEFTLSSTDLDFYDVEIINGINLPIQMSPNLSAKYLRKSDGAAPYTCGSPGAAQPSSPLLGACTWQFTPPSNDYRWVQSGGINCSIDSDCKSPSVCGLSFNPGNNPLLKKTCGTLIGYWTADQVCGIQRDYGAPFNCAVKLPTPQNALTMWNLYACVDIGSCYQDGAVVDCCGCTNWDQTGVKVPSAPYTKQCTNQNPTWINNVQPTLQWMKQGCPTAYTYPYDDMSSTFTCGIMQAGINTTNYTVTYCPTAITPPPAQTFDYMVYVGFPFKKVIINSKISCPDAGGNPACLVQKQAVGTHLVITGVNKDICTLAIKSDGSVAINASQSVGCNINASPATSGSPGSIALPSGF